MAFASVMDASLRHSHICWTESLKQSCLYTFWANLEQLESVDCSGYDQELLCTITEKQSMSQMTPSGE